MPAKKLVHFFATGFYCGLVPAMPGTVGTVAAIPLFLVVSRFFSLSGYIVFVVGFILFSIWISGKAEAQAGRKDPREIVIDEMAGFLVAMTALPPGVIYIVAGFVLFRLFDIVKPFPIGMIDKKLKGGKGIVLDDVVAGIYANIAVQVGSRLISSV